MIEPVIKLGGSAFNGNSTQASRPIPQIIDPNNPKLDRLLVVSLREWCDRNFISRDMGYKLIKLKYLVAFRRHGQWWVTANPDCVKEIINLLDVEKLVFDVAQ